MKHFLLILFFLISLISIAQKSIVSNIEFIGNKKIKSTFLTKIISTKKGDLFNKTIAKQDLITLMRLPSISEALFTTTPTDNGYVIRFKIKEKITTIPGANFYTTNNDEFAYRLSFYEFNFLGKNITLGGFYQKDIFDSFGANFRAPFLFNKKLGISFNYLNLTTQEPVFLDTTTLQYKYNNTGYEITSLYQFTIKHRTELGFSLFNESYEYLEGDINGEVPLTFDVNKFQIKLKYEYNNTKTKNHYVTGFKNISNIQQIISSNAILPNFIIGWNDFLYYKRIAQKGNFATRIRLGLATNDPSPFAPFAVDNNINIRGVGNIIDRGTGVVVTNIEHRHTVYEKGWFVLQSNVFLDAGSWRTPKGDFSDFVDRANFRIYPGAGLRFIHKKIYNAVFRIDYGYGLTDKATQGLVFGIGQYF